MNGSIKIKCTRNTVPPFEHFEVSKPRNKFVFRFLWYLWEGVQLGAGDDFFQFTQNSSEILNRMALWPSLSYEHISFSGYRLRKYIIPPVRLRGFKVIQISQYGYNLNHRWERKTLNFLTHLRLILVSWVKSLSDHQN